MNPIRRVLYAGLLAGLLIFQPASTIHAANWESLAQRVAMSTVFVSSSAGTCTGFSINDRQHYFLTALHCLGPDQKVDGKPATGLYYDPANDLMVLFAPDVTKPILRPGPSVVPGQMVGAFGFAYGLKARFNIGWVAAQRFKAPADEPDFAGEWVCLGVPLIPGMSGGPVVDENGRVVSINQWTTGVDGYGRDIGVMWASVGAYWRR